MGKRPILYEYCQNTKQNKGGNLVFSLFYKHFSTKYLEI